MRVSLLLVLCFASSLVAVPAPAPVPVPVPARGWAGTSITVSAAISLKHPLTAAADAYAARTGNTVRLNFGATGRLLAQVQQGAPVDLFIAASDDHADRAAAEHLVDPKTRTVIAGNTLVLAVPRDGGVAIDSFAALAAPSVRRVALGEPRIVPAGQYAMQVLRALELESALKEKIVHGASVRQVLDYVQRGEVDAGIVYQTDADAARDAVRIVATAPARRHDPIRYVAVTVAASGKAAAVKDFVDFLASRQGQAIFASHGFAPPSPATAPAPAGAAAPAPVGASATAPAGARAGASTMPASRSAGRR